MLARRRRLLQGNNVSTLRDDVAALVAALGGNAAVPALYDVRRNVTTALSNTVVSSWADARGAAGFGPALTASGTKRPAWDPSGLTMTFDGLDDCLACALTSRFDLAGACSVFLVGAIQQSAAASNPGGVADNIAVNLLFRNTAGAGGTIQGESTSSTVNSTIVVSSTRRLVVVSKNAATDLSIDVPNHVRVSTASTAAGAANAAFSVGNYFTGGGRPAVMVARAAGFLAAPQITAAQLATLLAWSVAQHVAVTA